MIFRRGMPVPPRMVGVVVVAIMLAATAFGLVAHKGIPFKDYRLVTAAFREVAPRLTTNSDVRVSGKRVGRVQAVTYENGEARVRLQLPGGMDVYRDATARIRSLSNVGEKYVDIDPGTRAAGPLGDAVIPKERTTSQVELDQVLSALDRPTREALGSTIRELGAGVGGRSTDLADITAVLPDLVGDVGAVTGALASEDTRLEDLLVRAETVLGRLAGREETLERLTGRLHRTLTALDADGALEESLHRLPGTLEALTPAVAELGSTASALTPALAGLRSGAVALGDATPDLRGALRAAPEPLAKVPGLSELANPAVDALTAAVEDLRPVAPALHRTLSSAAVVLGTLAPYAPELTLLVDRLASTLGDGDRNGHWVRVLPLAEPGGETPGLPPRVRRNPYPAPGEAATDGRTDAGAERRSP